MAHILMIDDSELALEFTRLLLEADGHRVSSTTDPTEFMQLAEQSRPRPDVVMVDSVMPDVSGPELIVRLRHHPDPTLASIPILLTTALEHQHPTDEGVLVLSKPFSPDELEQALKLVLG